MKKTTNKPVEDSAENDNERHFLLRHPLLLPVIIFITIFLTGLFLFVVVGSETVGASDRRIVHVSYDGNSQTVPTRAKTVGDLLTKLNITVQPKDIIEPAKETPIVEDNFKINIYRARSVEVVDGVTKKIIHSASLNPKTVAQEAGISLVPDDAARFVRPEDSVRGPVVAEQVVIERSVPITVSLYGTIGQYRTRAKTLAGFLEEKNILLKIDESTQPADPKTPIVQGMFISINTEGKSVVSVNEPIPFATETKTNPTLPAGQSKKLQEGRNGTKAVLYELAKNSDGVETGRRLLQTVVLEQPISAIIEKGTLAVASYSVSGDKAALMAAAGIDPSQFASVDYIIQKESNWRPAAINSQGCIGLGQRCPINGNNALIAACPAWQTDPVCQLRHFSAYANGRYGSWNNAYQVWVVQRWW